MGDGGKQKRSGSQKRKVTARIAINCTPAQKAAILDKANGAGLSLALDSFGVTFDSNGSTARLRSADAAALDETLFIRVLPLAAGWHGAVAASGDGWTLRFPG